MDKHFIKDHIKTAYRRWTDYHGRSSRPEFWIFTAYYLIACFLIGLVGELTFDDLMEFVLSAFVFVHFFVGLPLAIRRMHDSGRSGWWLLLNIIPFLGSLIIFIFMLLPGQDGTNRYGADPLRYQHAPGQEVL